jgi:cytochrome c oxidase assembly protein subunit 15
VVRLTGSGLSIPDWPIINGSLLPPFTDAGWQAVQEDYRQEAIRLGRPAFPVDLPVSLFRTQFWIEYMHRAIAAMVGIMMAMIFIFAFRSPPVKAKIEANLYILCTLLLGQAGLGGVVVIGALEAVMITVHLMVAYLFLAYLIWTAMELTDRRPVPAGGSRSAGLIPLRWAWITVGMIALQVAVGGLVAGLGHETLITTWPLMFGSFIPPAELLANSSVNGTADYPVNPLLVQFIHRWLPLLVIVAYVMLRMNIRSVPLGYSTKLIFRATESLLVLQIMIGIINVMYGGQTMISSLHSAVALCIFGGMIMALYDLRNNAGELHLPQVGS